jgi:ketosteroid isomerase-like protein
MSIPQPDLAALEKARQEYITTCLEDNLEGLLDTFTDDAAFFPPDIPPVRGKEALRAWLKEDFFDLYRNELDFTFDEVEITGGWAWAVGPWSQRLTPKAGGGAIHQGGKFLDIFRRQDDGSWKFARLMFTVDQPGA